MFEEVVKGKINIIIVQQTYRRQNTEVAIISEHIRINLTRLEEQILPVLVRY
jgi:hypothetical protein